MVTTEEGATRPVSAATQEAKRGSWPMAVEEVDTIVVGGGQAGIAMSEHLTDCGVPHLVLERHRIAERWRSGRWDSLAMNRSGVARPLSWHGVPEYRSRQLSEQGDGRRLFRGLCKEDRGSCSLWRGRQESGEAEGSGGFSLDTSHGRLDANSVVVATGAFPIPDHPANRSENSGVLQIHSAAYRNPDQLPEGAVLVVARAPRECRLRKNCCWPAGASVSRRPARASASGLSYA